jgi:hypothetical protein
MTLQSSGQISLLDIQNEFGGSAPIGIDEYYGAGGAPASGTISIGDFYGRSAFTWTQDIMGAHVHDFANYTGGDTFDGNIIYPPSSQSPAVFSIFMFSSNQPAGSTVGYLYLYVGGSLTNTYTLTANGGASSASYFPIIYYGSSSLRFISILYDYSTPEDTFATVTVYQGPRVYYHSFNARYND